MSDIDVNNPVPGLHEISTESIELSKAIAEQGIQNLLSGAFMILSFTMVVVVLYQIFTQNRRLDVIAGFSKKAMGYFEDYAFRNVNLDQARGLITSKFEHARYEIVVQTIKIKQSNNLQDKDYVEAKIDAFIDKSYSSVISLLRKFTYQEKNLSSYMESAWKAKIRIQMLRDCETHEINVQKIDDTYNLLFNSFIVSFNIKIDES